MTLILLIFKYEINATLTGLNFFSSLLFTITSLQVTKVLLAETSINELSTLLLLQIK